MFNKIKYFDSEIFIEYKDVVVNFVKVIIMNKILFNFLIVGVSLAGIQGASAMEDDNQNPPQPLRIFRNVKNIPSRIPCTPMKSSARHFGHAREAESPNEYEMVGGILWKKVPPRPTAMNTYK